MRQRPGQSRRSRKFSRRGSLGWYRKRMRFVMRLFEGYRVAERESFDRMLRNWTPYRPADIPEPRVQFIRDGSVWP